MSARGNGGATIEPHEAYLTPGWCVHRLLDAIGDELPDGVWIEPFAGEGDIPRAVDAHRRAHGRRPVEWTLFEQRVSCNRALLDYEDVCFGDTFWHLPRHRMMDEAAVFITNTPFSRAVEFLELTIREAPRAWLVMLVRQGFQASAERAELLRAYTPDAFHLPDRPPFGRVNGRARGTDRADYNWLVFPPEPRRRRRFGRNAVLETTPVEVRRYEAKSRAAWASFVGAPSAKTPDPRSEKHRL